jgi:hypothetical protein
MADPVTITRLAPAWDTPAIRAQVLTIPAQAAASDDGAVIYRGRNTLVRLDIAGTTVIAKLFPPKRGWKKLVRRGDKAVQAFDHSARLVALGLGTPAPYAALACADGSTCYVCAWAPGCRAVWDLHDDKIPDSDRHCADLGRFVAAMHNAGAFHRDNTPGNVLLSPVGDHFAHLVVDTNRMRFGRVGMWSGIASLLQLECQERLLPAYITARGWSPALPTFLFRLLRASHRVKWFFKDGTRPLRRKLGF